MIRYAIPLVALTTCPLPALAEPNIPSWCCPNTCQVVDSDRRGLKANGRDIERIPFSKNLYRGDAPDGLTRVCIGFDAFGDPEIKCLFSPLPLT